MAHEVCLGQLDQLVCEEGEEYGGLLDLLGHLENLVLLVVEVCQDQMVHLGQRDKLETEVKLVR